MMQASLSSFIKARFFLILLAAADNNGLPLSPPAVVAAAMDVVVLETSLDCSPVAVLDLDLERSRILGVDILKYKKTYLMATFHHVQVTQSRSICF